ncbi:MAG TPA: lipoyl synthase [Nitrososphaeraceae archaeon]|jgi:lipoic acid synthetase|nr:lipoyl synthase [Nitrososphaeraceae archaeon]
MELIRKPVWLRVRAPSGENYTKVKQSLRSLELHTVCEEARCPNISECWGTGTATIMIMGDICTRGCRFCAVNRGKPVVLLDAGEPERVAKAIKEWGLRYVVITSVCRDDLEDGGAEHIAKTIKSIKLLCHRIIVESLIPDFRGDEDSIKKVVESKPEVISHNIETVTRLTPKVRDARASYEQSLLVLKKIKDMNSLIYTKSSIMLGLGETEEEIIQTMRDLRSVGVNILTMGQYLQPTPKHLPVVQYVTPEKFNWIREIAEQMGFVYVASGPLVRSSYKAGEFFVENVIRHNGI